MKAVAAFARKKCKHKISYTFISSIHAKLKVEKLKH